MGLNDKQSELVISQKRAVQAHLYGIVGVRVNILSYNTGFFKGILRNLHIYTTKSAFCTTKGPIFALKRRFNPFIIIYYRSDFRVTIAHAPLRFYKNVGFTRQMRLQQNRTFLHIYAESYSQSNIPFKGRIFVRHIQKQRAASRLF